MGPSSASRVLPGAFGAGVGEAPGFGYMRNEFFTHKWATGRRLSIVGIEAGMEPHDKRQEMP